MKKQVKVIIGIVVAIAIMIVAISFFFPAAIKSLTSGTFGKADKYRNQQMTEKDILLRSNLVSDNGQLRDMIQGLIYFSLFTNDMNKNIDSCIHIYNAQGMGSKAEDAAKINLLKDYSDFIKNNNKTLGITISMLTGFYLKDDSDQSADVEKNLRDFGNYVSNLNEKDSVLNLALRTMDNFMLSNKTLTAKKTELASLKSIRDQLLLQGIQLAGLLQDKPLCAQLIGYALSSQPALNVIILGREQLGFGAPAAVVILNQDKLGSIIGSKDVAFGSNEQLGKLIQAQQLGKDVNNSKQELGNILGSIMVYDKASLQFLVGNKGELQKVLSATQMSAILQGSALGLLTGVALFSSQGLNLYQSNLDLKSGFLAQQGNLGMQLSNTQLNQVLGNQLGGGGLIVVGSAGFVNMVGQLGSMGLGVTPVSQQ